MYVHVVHIIAFPLIVLLSSHTEGRKKPTSRRRSREREEQKVYEDVYVYDSVVTTRREAVMPAQKWELALSTEPEAGELHIEDFPDGNVHVEDFPDGNVHVSRIFLRGMCMWRIFLMGMCMLRVFLTGGCS